MYISDEEFGKMTEKLAVLSCDADGEVAKKEYMGSVDMTGAYMMPGVKRIGRWALAYCSKLGVLWVPSKHIFFDGSVFLDDDALAEIIVYERLLNGYQIAYEERYLLANAMRDWYEENQYDFSDVGTDGWYVSYDEALARFISSPDEKGFHPFLAGGEEDYEDEQNDIEYYKKGVRIKKALAIFERMMVKHPISDVKFSFFKDFLKDNFDEAMNAIFVKKTDAYRYLRRYLDEIQIDRRQADSALQLFSDNLYAECRAMIMSMSNVFSKAVSVWEDFTL